MLSLIPRQQHYAAKQASTTLLLQKSNSSNLTRISLKNVTGVMTTHNVSELLNCYCSTRSKQGSGMDSLLRSYKGTTLTVYHMPVRMAK